MQPATHLCTILPAPHVLYTTYARTHTFFRSRRSPPAPPARSVDRLADEAATTSLPLQQHFKVGHPPPYSDVAGAAPVPSPPPALHQHQLGEDGQNRPPRSDALGDDGQRPALPPYRDVEEEEAAGDGEPGEALAYVMHPEDFPERRGWSRRAALGRWVVRSCDCSLALFFVGFAVVGVVI